MINTKRKSANWVLSNPMESEIARGNIDGMSDFIGFGERDHISETQQGCDLWGGTATSPPWPDQLGGEQMMVVSSNHDDRLTGTGIQKVEVDYLDAIGHEQYETINMNGTAFVRTVGTNIRFVNAIHAMQIGSGTVSSGDVSICANGTLVTTYSMIPIGGNMSLNSQRMVPYGKTFYLYEWTASAVDQTAAATQAARVRLRATAIHGTRVAGVFLFNDTAQLNNSFYAKKFAIPKKIPQLSVIKATAWVNGTALYVAASYSGCLEENE